MRPNGFRTLTAADALEINQPVMTAVARTLIFADELRRPQHDFAAIESRHVGVMRAVLISTMCDMETTAEEVIGRIQLQNGVKGGTAREHLYEAESLGLVRMELDDADRRKNWWSLRPGIPEKLTKLALVTLDIANVVRAQIDDPKNKDAGRELIHPDYYFNILDPENKQAARTALDAILAPRRATKKE